MTTERQPEPANENVHEYEHVDPETIIDDVGKLFEPDNKQLPPLNPDTPPTEGSAGVPPTQAPNHSSPAQ